jgi:thiol-disulfide isomerase/thioredoxin
MKQLNVILFFIGLSLVNIQLLFAADTGDASPNCALNTIGDTRSIDLRQFRGKVLYVDFWASWCGPCAKSFPFLNELNAEFHERGLEIVGINLDENPEEARNFLAEYPAHFSVATNVNNKCAKDFGVKAMPSSYIVDRHGIIRHLHLGFRPGEAQDLRKLVEQLLAEAPVGK